MQNYTQLFSLCFGSKGRNIRGFKHTRSPRINVLIYASKGAEPMMLIHRSPTHAPSCNLRRVEALFW